MIRKSVCRIEDAIVRKVSRIDELWEQSSWVIWAPSIASACERCSVLFSNLASEVAKEAWSSVDVVKSLGWKIFYLSRLRKRRRHGWWLVLSFGWDVRLSFKFDKVVWVASLSLAWKSLNVSRAFGQLKRNELRTVNISLQTRDSVFFSLSKRGTIVSMRP